MKLKTGQVIAERYEIDDTLGQGGMSVVYRAHDKKLDRYVTFKVLKEEYLSDENLLGRFPEEARAAAGLNHQNIVSIFDHGRDGDVQYIVLEYVDGASLKELINKKAPFDDETNLGVAIQVAEGLSEAHRNNIIHLDIKPQNILVTTTSVVKVADFGIARAAKSATLTAGAGSMGSVHYFSPEQARGGYIDHKSDIYSLGIVMFEMAAGRPPFEGDTEVSIALQHLNDPLPDLQKINPKVSESVIKIIQKATEKSASKRYQTVDDMAEDLKRALTDASGNFVEIEENIDESPTLNIEQNRDEIRRRKLRSAFLDGTETPSDEPPQYTDYTSYQDGQEYEGYYEDYEQYEDYEFAEPPAPRAKKSDRIAVYLGIVAGVIAAVLIFVAAYNIQQRLAPTRIPAPEIEGLTVDAAQELARELGIHVVVQDYAYSDDVEEGSIIQQLQSPGLPLGEGDTLHVIVSLGEAMEYRMPHLVFSNVDAAVELLGNLPFDVEHTIEMLANDDFERDMIMEQEPSAGSPIRSGDTVILRVSAGPETGQVEVPLLIHLTEAEAGRLVREARLIEGSITRIESTTFPSGVVMSQDPEAGTAVDRDTMVNITVSTGAPTPEPTPTPTPTPPPDENDTDGQDPPDTTTPDPPPAARSRTFTIDPGQFPEGTEQVRVEIWRQVGNELPVIFANETLAVTAFPRPVNVQGTEQEIFHITIFIADVEFRNFMQEVDFRE